MKTQLDAESAGECVYAFFCYETHRAESFVAMVDENAGFGQPECASTFLELFGEKSLSLEESVGDQTLLDNTHSNLYSLKTTELFR